MIEIIEWLIEIENCASELYYKSADLFIDDIEFHRYLKQCEIDETWHYHVMASAAEFVRGNNVAESSVIIDNEIKDKIEKPLRKGLDMINKGTLTKESLIKIVVDAEFSEWNDIFLYIIKNLTLLNRQFIHPASIIQNHMRFVENFLESDESGSKYIKDLKEIPGVWDEKILVVDDEEAILDFLEVILDDFGTIDKSCNGSEALEKIKENYYGLIISDVSMPELNGFQLLEKADESFPDIKSRFLFFTGNKSDESLKFFNDNKMNYILKPASIKELREMVINIIRDNSKSI